MSNATHIIDMTILVAGVIDELHRHGYIDGGLTITPRYLARYDQLMAAPWRPGKQELKNYLDFVLDSFEIDLDEVTRDDWFVLIWRWLNGEFDEQKETI